jgi:hypothetical protein
MSWRKVLPSSGANFCMSSVQKTSVFTLPEHGLKLNSRNATLAGRWLCQRYRAAAKAKGYLAAAKRLRKQGVPLFMALRVLGIAESR